MGNASSSLPALRTVERLDVTTMMGSWFVVGVMPTPFEVGAYNAKEIYSQSDDGTIAIDFKFNKGNFDGPVKSFPQRGWWGPDTTTWKVSPFWPLKLPYLVVEATEKLDADDAWFVVGYPSRAYCWIMARKPEMADETYEGITRRLVDTHAYPEAAIKSKLVKVPHRW
mmetsp:Transcript_7462/g.19418  ORF Transcript_7462/g.19418 Transcript_7462/m.19418 type:complete len:168 (+) Transcript_7462:26-529(+)|eukprot:CAMPEP_0197421586 /NCGR_PEP_ID=MMETSP1170-20131217/9740_1 /TAXON_ID=54406 /ORGANISM="Sarcinochrysis sp, Strain CCMP770" /LENGTH=167 /DNA_ID=CAMNT_0042948839 /DNA_START=26 /DNA_END=529 /DNA_ORIENTATION=+